MSVQDHIAKLESLLETVRRNAQKPRVASVVQPLDALPTPPPAAVREPVPAPAKVAEPVAAPAPVAARMPVAVPAPPPPAPPAPVAAGVPPPAAPPPAPVAVAAPPLPAPSAAAPPPAPAAEIVPIEVTVESPLPVEVEELDMTETEIVEVAPGSTDEIPDITPPEMLEPIPESAPRPAVQTIEREIEREIEPPVKTPPPESGRQALTPVPGTPYANLAEGAAKAPPEPLTVTRPEAPDVVAAEIVASKPARLPETFLELVDASLRLG